MALLASVGSLKNKLQAVFGILVKQSYSWQAVAHLMCFTLGVLTIVTSAGFADEATTDARFLDGLRQHELYELAEFYCQKRLAEQDVTGRDRAELTIQWARTLAQQAAGSLPAQQPALWQQAQEVLDTWLVRNPDSPWRVLVAMQRALVSLAQGELARHQTQVGAQGGVYLELARTELRQAVGQLARLVEQVDQMQIASQRMPGRSSHSGQAEAFSTDELISLGRNIRYQLARALMSQGECYARDSADRAHSLTQAARWLDELTGLPQGDPVVWKSRLARARCYRLLSDYASAQAALTWIEQHHPPAAVALDARIESVRLALEQDQIDRAVELLAIPEVLAKIDQPEWDFVRLETCLAAWRAAEEKKNTTAVKLWQTRATDLVHRIQARHGAYWTRRAEMLLGTTLRHAAGGSDLDMLVLAAKNAYLGGRPDEAVTLYEQAASAAAKQSNRAKALELGYLAATILQKQGRYDEAARRARRWAVEMADATDAPKVHLEAIRNQAQSMRKAASGSLDSLITLLEEHLHKWPNSSTAAEARWLLGGAWRYRQDWDRAIAVYQGIATNDVRFADVPDTVGACCEEQLAALRAKGQPIAGTAQRMAQWFESITRTTAGRFPERLSPAARRAVLWAARLWLQSGGNGYERARQLLAGALAVAPDAPDVWRREAEALLAVSLAGSGRTNEAAAVLAQLVAAPADVVLDVLAQLEQLAKTAPAEYRSRLATVQLKAADLLAQRQSELTAAQRVTLQRVRAGALAAAGRGEEALQQYAALAQTHPNDGAVREAYAKLLSTRNDRRSLETALAEWRKIERRAKSGSARWFRAKYALAELHLRLGHPEQAEKIIRLVALLHPDLGGTLMKSQFEQLLARCKKP